MDYLKTVRKIKSIHYIEQMKIYEYGIEEMPIWTWWGKKKEKNTHAMYEIIEVMLKNVFFSLINVCASSKIDVIFKCKIIITI